MKQHTSGSPPWTNSPRISGSERYLFIVLTHFLSWFFIERKELLIGFIFLVLFFSFFLQDKNYLLCDILLNIKFFCMFSQKQKLFWDFFLSISAASINSFLWLTFHVNWLLLKEDTVEEDIRTKLKLKD